MASRTDVPATGGGRPDRFVTVGALAAACLGFLSLTPAQAQIREVEPSPAPSYSAPRQEQRQMTPNNAGRTAVPNALEAVRGSRMTGGRVRANLQLSPEQIKALEKKKKKLEKKIADLEKEFLDSKEGKDAKKKIEEEEKKRAKRRKALREEKKKKQAEKGDNCCGYGETIKIIDWQMEQEAIIDDDFDKARAKILDGEMKKKDPKKAKEREKAKNDLDKAKSDIKKAKQGNKQNADGSGGSSPPPPIVQP